MCSCCTHSWMLGCGQPFLLQLRLLKFCVFLSATAAITEREKLTLGAMIDNLGGFPAIDRQWNPTEFDLTRSIGLVRKILSHTPLFVIYVGPDERNSTASRIIVSIMEADASVYLWRKIGSFFDAGASSFLLSILKFYISSSERTCRHVDWLKNGKRPSL